jgi:hypothetical protein
MAMSTSSKTLGLRHIVLSFVLCLMAYPVSLMTDTTDATEAPQVSLTSVLAQLQAQWKENQRNYVREQRSLHTRANSIRDTLCDQGVQEHCPQQEAAPATVVAQNVDIVKLAHAVAVAETGGCTQGTGVSKNNCHGIFGCQNGVCGPKTFATKEESYAEFQRIWINGYGDRFPTLKDAQKYTYSEGSQWLNTVRLVYNQQ